MSPIETLVVSGPVSRRRAGGVGGRASRVNQGPRGSVQDGTPGPPSPAFAAAVEAFDAAVIGGPSARIPLAWRAGGAGVGVEELHAEVVAVALTAVWSLPVGLVRPSTPEGWEQRRERLAAWVEQARREVRA